MARLNVEGGDLVLNLSGLEKVEGFHGNIHVPVSSVENVRCTPDPWSELRGIRAPGTGVPWIILVGTRRAGGVKDFAAIHGHGPAIVVELAGADYGRLVVTEENAESATADLRQELGLS